MREEDLELLEVLQQLEEENANESHIDLDSSLAQLSQQHKQCKAIYKLSFLIIFINFELIFQSS